MRRPAAFLVVLPLLAVLGGCGGGDDEPGGRGATGGPAPRQDAGGGRARAPAGPAGADEPSPSAPDAAIGDRPGGPRDQAAVRVVRAYVEALARRDGAAVCRLVARSALRRVTLPRRRGSCAASVSASIGYRNPRGSPQWLGARIVGPPAISRAPYGARAVVPLRTEFADRGYVSREDDVVYLRPHGETWLVAKPSAVFFRAIGRANVPPTVLAPPRA